METLMRMQSSFDIAETRKREGQIRLRRVAGKKSVDSEAMTVRN
jgi:plasmid maintenance system antidote protein VapI